MNYNKVILSGNLTRDPELRYTPKGLAVCKFSIAINRTWTTETGESKKDVTFVEVDAFGRTAENISKFFKKGNCIFVEGRLQFQTWEDKTTKDKKSKLTVVCDIFQFVDKKSDSNGGQSAPSAAPTRTSEGVAAAPAQAANQPPAEEDDVPF
jgi:single-strand DNA-binding protein